uniref:Ecdysteroid UDP-glucosyltransferase n=1 Tax=Plutella xylostella granulovirus TaxID=98383 RepID=A0A142DWW1_9BBAC|nr:PxGV-Corf116 protein [Plutella xylostella granulovirus]AMQ35845.1 PxGV-Korf116 protein [Plutella xylostella granulovirus]AMQ36079.1 PxGV-Torf116 protein [Plutella xylostella granulovirus]
MTLKLLILFLGAANSANILCVFPTPSYSHHTVFKKYVATLSESGHNVTVITPFEYNDCHNCLVPSYMFQKLTTSVVVADETTVTKTNYMSLINLITQQMKSENVTSLLNNKDTKFDLVVAEAYLEMLLMFSHFYQAPVIQMSSGHALPENFETMGAVSRNAVKHPNLWRSSHNIDYENKLQREWKLIEHAQDNVARKQFNSRPLKILRENVKLLLVNVPTIMDNYRSVPQTVQYLGGLHLNSTTIEPLDDELKRFADKGKFIYVSFGATKDLRNFDILSKMSRTFSNCKYNVLWKSRSYFNISENIMTRDWLPQRSVLKHGNLKLFITQGGVQSIDEAIDNTVPMLVVPTMGDQFFNAKRIVDLGIGKKGDLFNTGLMGRQINKIIDNYDLFKDNLKIVKRLINDKPMSSTHASLWYTNYVLRNKDLKR